MSRQINHSFGRNNAPFVKKSESKPQSSSIGSRVDYFAQNMQEKSKTAEKANESGAENVAPLFLPAIQQFRVPHPSKVFSLVDDAHVKLADAGLQCPLQTDSLIGQECAKA